MKPSDITLDEWLEDDRETKVQVLVIALSMYHQQKKNEDAGNTEMFQIGGAMAYCMIEDLKQMYPEDAAEGEITFIQKYQS